ncbi:MAG: hypothetical protein M4579_001286 [Chaenotheca gracillima]|nr:MAG: hypothetical protein M4579_001286 [Chaenotheca gracillima]
MNAPPAAGLESQNSRDARVERLWQTLDTRKEGHLDLNGLKKGLRKMDHPLKNADSLLKDVLQAVDANGDGKIVFEEFRDFVEETEKELQTLFNSIDRDNNGKLDKSELQAAFLRAGLAVPKSKLDQFFEEVDTNRDGVISFDEWRNFLLFIPSNSPSLQAVLTYYSNTVMVNPEGDVQISDEKNQGLGTRPAFPTSFLAAIASISSPHNPYRILPIPARLSQDGDQSSQATAARGAHALAQHQLDLEPSHAPDLTPPPRDPEPIKQKKKRPVLTALLPSSGYFIAGALAGAVSRTATAPLDRLKVYLIAQTGVSREAVEAAKSGSPVRATKQATRPLVDASKALWRAGGMRSLFAGNGLNVLKVMPESAIKFGSYEASKRAMAALEGHRDPTQISSWSRFVCGGVGGMISQFFVYPIDTLKFRMQCETVEGGLKGNMLIVETAKKMWSSHGMRSFYRGLPMGLVGMFPYAAIDLGTFEYLKRALATRNARARGCHEEDAPPGNFATAAIGAFSGALGASVVYPLNLLRTRLQTQGTAVHPPTYTGIMDVTRKTFKGEGFRGFFRGITPNLLKVVPAVSITYVTYENSKALLNLR